MKSTHSIRKYTAAVVLLSSIYYLVGCSGSGDSESAGDVNVADVSDAGDMTSGTDPEGDVLEDSSAGNTADSTDTDIGNNAEETASGTADTVTDTATDTVETAPVENEVAADNQVLEDPMVAPPVVDIPATNPAVPDPLTQNTTRVDFQIEVPAYQSNALQVRLLWGDKDFTAAWVGDEMWSASDDFPTNTLNQLTVTFNDDNGATTLGSFEQDFRTGTNASESFVISASQFNTDRWDSDGDGVSNLDELLADGNSSELPRVLLFSETRGFRHDSIPDALAAIEQLVATSGIESDRAGDSVGVFTAENLANYDAVIWVLTSGDVLDDGEQAAFENYVRAGGGYAGVHAASDTEYDWPWYGGLVGAYFQSHPQIQSATLGVENGSHLSTTHLGATWIRTDEWYDFQTNPRAQVNVLLTLDESTYSGGQMGEDHPIAWFHEYEGGRSWYTGGGHTIETYAEPDFRAHLLGGIRYVIGQGN